MHACDGADDRRAPRCICLAVVLSEGGRGRELLRQRWSREERQLPASRAFPAIIAHACAVVPRRLSVQRAGRRLPRAGGLLWRKRERHRHHHPQQQQQQQQVQRALARARADAAGSPQHHRRAAAGRHQPRTAEPTAATVRTTAARDFVHLAGARGSPSHYRAGILKRLGIPAQSVCTDLSRRAALGQQRAARSRYRPRDGEPASGRPPYGRVP